NGGPNPSSADSFPRQAFQSAKRVYQTRPRRLTQAADQPCHRRTGGKKEPDNQGSVARLECERHFWTWARPLSSQLAKGSALQPRRERSAFLNFEAWFGVDRARLSVGFAAPPSHQPRRGEHW